MTVRLAGPADAEALVSLVSAFRDHLGADRPSVATLRHFLPELLADEAAELSLAFSPEGAPIGYANCRFFRSLWSTSWEAHLEDLFVLEPSRGAGSGRGLLDFVVARARERRCAAIGLHTNEANTRAQAFYRRMHFEVASEARWDGGRECYWVRELDDEVEAT